MKVFKIEFFFDGIFLSLDFFGEDGFFLNFFVFVMDNLFFLYLIFDFCGEFNICLFK